MRQLRAWFLRLGGLFNKEQRDREFSDEMESHLQMHIEDNVRSGMSGEEARRIALIKLGGVEQTKEIYRDRRSLPFLETLFQDLRFGARMLRKNPGFTAVVVLTLALGIGANTAIFTLFDAVLLESLPVREPVRLVLFTDSISEGASSGDPPSSRWEYFSTEAYEYLRRQPLPFESLAAVRSGEDTVSVRLADSIDVGGPVQRASAHLVSGNYFRTMGVEAALGRTLGPDDDRPGAPPVAVASYAYWKQRLHGDPVAAGKTIYLNDSAFTIVGVTPPEFFGERVRSTPDLWMPLVFQPQIELRPSYLERTDTYWLKLIGRLSGTATRAQAQAATSAMLQQFLTNKEGSKLAEARKREIAHSHVELVDGAGGISWLRLAYSQPLHILLAVVALVLLIACANVGNLLLSRTAIRQAEISARMALGASRVRLIRQLLTESLLLAALGATCGVLLAQWVVNALMALVAKGSPLNPHLNAPVLAFTIGVTFLSGILFGLAPALSAGRTDLAASLKAGGRSTAGCHKQFGATRSLIIAQIAVSLVLLVGASLFARSLLNLEKQPLGFNQDHVLLASLSPRLANYKPESVSALYRKLHDRLSALPGVRSSTLARYSPMSGSLSNNSISIEGHAEKQGEELAAENILVAPSYAETMGMALLQGREIGLQDTPGSPKVAMVNEAFVRAYFPGRAPLGHRFGFGGEKQAGECEIVGVLRDAQFHDAKQKVGPMTFIAMMQDTTQFALTAEIAVRTVGEPGSMAGAVRQAVAEVDPNLPLTRMQTLHDQIASTFDVERVVAELVGFFGVLALLLACVGLYGVVSQSVLRRTNEIGVRMALGAQGGDILWMVLRNTIVLLAAGLAIGIPAALAATRLIKSQLYGVGAADPASLVIAALILVGVATLAGLLPARRAMHVDPVVALRYE